MYSPSLDEVKRFAEEYNLVPIARTVMADTETPIRVFQHFFEDEQAFLLESVEGGVNWGRYSFIGTDPFLVIRGKSGKIHFEVDGQRRVMTEHPIEGLRTLLSSYRSPLIHSLPRFTGGAVGFFSYDLIQYYQDLPPHPHDDMQMDDLHFMFCDQVIAFDHFKQQMKVIGNVHIREGATEEEVEAAYEATTRKIEATIARLQQMEQSPYFTRPAYVEDVELGEIQSNMTKSQFVDHVKEAQKYIANGDVSQVVFSQRFELDTEASPFEVYRVLRTLNPSPYMYYLKLFDEIIVGSSPELLVRVEDQRVHTRPIAGTRPRGKTPEEDERLAKELLADQKEIDEHQMLIDLSREDLAKVTELSTISCDHYMEVEKYSHVMHIVSHMSGELREGFDFYDALLACTPAGTLSGNPRVRAMEIIAELEPQARGAYAGAIGYLGFSGNLETCITIRTVIFKNGKAYVQAGAGIVADSVAESEYDESVNKATALLKAIRIAEEMFIPSRKEEAK